MKKAKELRHLGLKLALAATTFWMIWFFLYGFFPWGYSPDQVAIFRIWDGAFFLPWAWLLKKSYPEPAFDSAMSELKDKAKRLLIWLGIFAGLSFQLLFSILTGEADLIWWHIEIIITTIILIAILLLAAHPIFLFNDKLAPYAIVGISFGISAGCLITVGLYMGIMAVLGTAILVGLMNYERNS